MIGGIITICAGILAASAFIIAKKPDAQEWIDKLTPYEGWIGLCTFGWGVFDMIGVLTSIGMLGEFPLRWVFWLCVAVADLLVGFILGFKLISKYALSKNEAALAKGQAIRGKLTTVQIPIGFFAIVMGVLYTVWLFI
jgi:hypothetical protein